jgi:hypothetical protein
MDDRELVGASRRCSSAVEDVPEGGRGRAGAARTSTARGCAGSSRAWTRRDGGRRARLAHCCCCTICTRAVEERVRGASTRCARTSGRTAATSSCWVSRTAWCVCASTELPAAARPRVTLRMAIEEAIYRRRRTSSASRRSTDRRRPALLQIEDLTCPLPMAGRVSRLRDLRAGRRRSRRRPGGGVRPLRAPLEAEHRHCSTSRRGRSAAPAGRAPCCSTGARRAAGTSG